MPPIIDIGYKYVKEFFNAVYLRSVFEVFS
jgi:hypothetical protein